MTQKKTSEDNVYNALFDQCNSTSVNSATTDGTILTFSKPREYAIHDCVSGVGELKRNGAK